MEMITEVEGGGLDWMDMVIENLAHLPHLAITLNRLLFPTLGMPTIPILRLLEGLPSRAFFSTTVFLGGILFLIERCEVAEIDWAEEVENKVWSGLGVSSTDGRTGWTVTRGRSLGGRSRRRRGGGISVGARMFL
jgi:hypothetical protein